MRSQPDDMATIDVDPSPQLQPRRNNFALHVVRGPRAGEVLVVESDCLLGRGDDVQLHWSRWSRSGELSESLRERPVMRLAAKVWQRLPLPVANTLGPLVSPGLPSW